MPEPKLCSKLGFLPEQLPENYMILKKSLQARGAPGPQGPPGSANATGPLVMVKVALPCSEAICLLGWEFLPGPEALGDILTEPLVGDAKDKKR